MRAFFFVLWVLLAFPPSVSAIDCNGNGIDDALDIEAGFSADCNDNHAPDECDNASLGLGLLRQRVRFPRFPRAVRAADLDGDGDLDLVTGNQKTDFSSTVSVMRNLGGREFAPIESFPAGERLWSVVVQDFDLDGDLDLAGSNVVHLVVLLNDGTATLLPPRVHDLEAETRFVLSADVDADGYFDLLTANTDADSVALLTNTGDGAFSAPASVAVGRQPLWIASGDFEVDGDTDLVVSNEGSSTLSVLENRGDGSFASRGEIDSGVKEPFAGTLRDFDEDGDLDFFAFGGGAATAAFFSNDGHGVFDPPEIFRLPGRAVTFAPGDFDGDGGLDLAVSLQQRDELAVLRQTRTGPRRPALSVYANVPRTRSLAAVDLDGDHAVDVTLIDDAFVTVLWNDEESADAAPYERQRYPVRAEPHTALAGDADGDGHVDLVTGNNSRVDGISLLRNQGSGALAEPARFGEDHASFSLAMEDFDGDGDLDVASADTAASEVLVVRQSAGGAFEEAARYRVGRGPAHVASADFDADSRLDLVTANSAFNSITVLWGREAGAFEMGEDTRVGRAPVAVAAADFDGDDAADIAVASVTSQEIGVFRNLGDGRFADKVDYPLPGRPSFLLATDLDGDGGIDLATAGETAFLLWNAGDGTFLSPVIREAPGSFSLTAADVNGDGRVDLVTAHVTLASVSVSLGTGQRSFDAAEILPVGVAPRFVVTGDFDRDGDTDLVSANHDSRDATVLLSRRVNVAGNFLGRVCTVGDFYRLSIPSGDPLARTRRAEYLLPVRGDARPLATTFPDAHVFSGPREYLPAAFPERFATLSGAEVEALVARRATREFFQGVLRRLPGDGVVVYAFTIAAATAADAGEASSLEEVTHVYETLAEVFALRPLLYLPETPEARAQAETWVEPPFRVLFDVPAPRGDVRFRRGDVNASGFLEVTDAIVLLAFLFQQGALACHRAADASGDGRLDVLDPVVLLGHVFGVGDPLPEPTSCGSGDGSALTCVTYAPCS